MTAQILTGVPLAIGGTVAALLGRAFAWIYAHVARAPLTSLALALMVTGYAMATTNALYLQTERHPAPLFSDTPRPEARTAQVPEVAPVVVAPQPPAQTAAIPPAPAAPAPTQPREATVVGNADMAEVQQKLKDMGLFDGTVDGFYGPKTADAIRAFEERFNLPRRGAMSPEILRAVREAPINSSAAQPAAQPQPQPQPQPMPPQLAPVEAAEAAPPAGVSIDSLVAEAAGRDAGNQPILTAGAIAPEPAAPEPAAAPEPEVVAVPEAVPPARDRELISTVQRGLSTLGFLHGPVDGVAGETTARAIRNFEIFHNYRPTGAVTPELVDLLVAAGASI